MPLALIMSSPALAPTSNGARLVSTDGRELPLTGTSLRADAAGGIARTVVEQRFTNPHKEPLSVTYSLPLPADGAVSGFAFSIGGKRIAGEVQRRGDARAAFERAVVEGRSAALLEQDRSSLFTQEIGNIPPGETIVAEITVDQPLAWLDEGAWEWRFPTVVAPRYLGEPGRVSDADRVMQDVAAGPIGARFTLECSVRDALAAGRSPESPSHRMQCAEEKGRRGATLRIAEGARLDRDVVVRWAVASESVGMALQVARPAADRAHSSNAYGLLTLVPPLAKSRGSSVSRDLIVLIDTSGSMGGAPLDQARRVVGALVDTLGPNDRLEMIEFSTRARRWKAGATEMFPADKREAHAWLKKLRAAGSTEMREGIREAMRSLRPEALRQVILVTDGQIGFEAEVVKEIYNALPASSRLHTVGVGSAVNRSLTGPAARAGHGIEVVIGLDEDPERAARRLVARTDAPLVVDLEISGSALVEHAPRKLPDLFAGAPALIGLSLRREGGELRVRGRTASGVYEQQMGIPPVEAGSGSEATMALYGREAIEDRELLVAAGGSRRALDAEIERLGLDFQLATRLTSWIAVTKEVTVDPGAPRRHERMPHELAHGMSAEGVGLRAASAGADAGDEAAVFASAAAADEGDEAGMLFSLGGLIESESESEARNAPTGRPAPMSAPAPFARPSAPMEMPQVETAHALPAKSRSRAPIVIAILLALIAGPIAYVIAGSIGIAAAVAVGVLLVVLLAGRLLR